MPYRVIRRLPVDRETGVTHDRLARLRGPHSRQLAPWPMRLIRYVDPKTARRLVFLTNQLDLPAVQVAMLYRKRWKIELLFKWMKQHLHIKSYFGTTSNAVKSQLWIAVIVLVLIHRLKQRLGLTQTPNDIAQILSVTLCEKIAINQAFFDNHDRFAVTPDHNQLPLFEL